MTPDALAYGTHAALKQAKKQAIATKEQANP
jgi:hypothetical protein